MIDVESGIIQRQFTPDVVDATENLLEEVSESYDGLEFEIKRP